MIIPCTLPFQDFIDFLNALEIVEDDVIITIIPHNSTVSVGDLEGFAVYSPDVFSIPVIFVGGNDEEMRSLIQSQNLDVEIDDWDVVEFMLQNIAHEFWHHVQWSLDEEFDEDEAEEMAHQLVEDYIKCLKEDLESNGKFH